MYLNTSAHTLYIPAVEIVVELFLEKKRRGFSHFLEEFDYLSHEGEISYVLGYVIFSQRSACQRKINEINL